MGRTIVFGDIHGGLKALEDLMKKVQPTIDDKFIFLGDYVDGWSQSAQVIRYLIAFEKQYNSIFIRGNHDTWCLGWLNGELPNEIWTFNGGAETLQSYMYISTEERQEHLAFFQHMRNFYIDDENRLFIHAGFSSMHGPHKEHYSSNYSWDRTLWELALSFDRNIPEDSVFYPKRLKLYKEIFIGHTPTTNYDVNEPMNANIVWNVDTGAAFRGKISALDINSKQFWQSEPVHTYYPNELGRNRDR
ncbi:serine/threonine protein phosphatase 1 [Chitinophaga skermanii]|uniref:Serine/threonine protein phosphatase 1 n=1 Tax=Chitinophaga skermanii TaxID=331697 RepID=A0A327QSF9_9BACT|nr:metallophosphoesterase family protein [Chitinophaga skermanii]RAJ06574.1 serine/threonine protein phosphatase 1 [Chitinophaga skermanii]